MMQSKQLMNTGHVSGPPSDNQLTRRQQALIAKVLPQLLKVNIETGGTIVSLTGKLEHEIIKRNMKARLKEKLGI